MEIIIYIIAILAVVIAAVLLFCCAAGRKANEQSDRIFENRHDYKKSEHNL